MFEKLTERLGDVFGRLTRRGALTEADVDAALREVRVALLEADVALPVVRDFLASVREKAIGESVLKSITPGQMVVKIVHDALVEALGGASVGIDLNAPAPVVVMMVGLQGSGKTTTTAKIALRLKTRERKRVLMASLDTRRPAAQEQLAVLGRQAEVATLPVIPGEPPVAIAKRALQTGRLEGHDVVILDTAGRLHVDEELMAEAAAVHQASSPTETLLVVDAMTGQDAVNVATQFRDRMQLTGVVLTRVDGDARGGAALSMRAVTGCPIKLIGAGEKLDALEDFHPDRIAGEQAEKMAAKLQKGQFDLDDFADQLRQLQKMGGLGGVLGMLPGVGKIQKQLDNAKIDEKLLRRQQAIISSMTRQERRRPELIKASRKQRIAGGSGASVQEINRLLKQHMEMARMVKQMGKLGQKGLMRHGIGALLRR
jgi:signal recognition particle subunit SRP54